jgi:excisionase family DNA binding protein
VAVTRAAPYRHDPANAVIGANQEEASTLTPEANSPPPTVSSTNSEPDSLAALLGVTPTPRRVSAARPPRTPRPAAEPSTGTPVVGEAPASPLITESQPEPTPADTASPVPEARSHPEQLLFTPAQAAVLLQVQVAWLRRKAACGQLGSVILGRRLLFSRTDLDALIEAHHRPARTDRPHA